MSETDVAVGMGDSIDVDAESSDGGSSYCFRWNDYRSHLSAVVRQLLEEDCMVDVTLSAAGERIHAHRIVLCACSSLFQEVLGQVNEDHPTIILSDISARNVRSIIEFTYHGEVRVPVEEIGSLLDAARSLKIYGLTEVDGFDDASGFPMDDERPRRNDDEDTLRGQSLDRQACPRVLREEKIIGASVLQCDDETEQVSHVSAHERPTETNDAFFGTAVADASDDKTAHGGTGRRRGRREASGKRDYSDDMLVSAINDLREGRTLIEAATRHNVPRSTLYMRAKSLGIRLNASRNEYPAECMRAAIDAVIGGSSLQHASEMFGIPKTVLWRRIQKEGCRILRSEMKRSYGSENREAAVKALERGENLTKVSLEFKIPKTTLFRDKARLVDEGKLPLSFWKRRRAECGESKRSRLEEAVAACRGGKMSQAAASVTYHIPKTTIWRRLQQQQQDCGEATDSRLLSSRGRSCGRDGRRTAVLCDGPLAEESPTSPSALAPSTPDFAYCEVASTPVAVSEGDAIPITYIDENSIPEDSVIILTTDDVVEGLDLEEGKRIVVNSESTREYVPCAMSIEEGASEFSQAEHS